MKTQEAPPSAEIKGPVRPNPILEQGAQSPAQTAGCSTAVTPINPYIAVLTSALPYVAVAVQLKAMLDSGGEFERAHKSWETRVEETIDLNDYLPTTYDDYRDWPTMANTGA